MNSARESHDTQQPERSIEVIPLQKLTAMPPSIVRVRSKTSEQGTVRKSQIQKRRVTWAL